MMRCGGARARIGRGRHMLLILLLVVQFSSEKSASLLHSMAIAK